MTAAYVTQDELVARYGEDTVRRLSDRTAQNKIDAARVAAAIAAAESLVNGYVAGVAALPFAAPPPLIKNIAADLSYFYLHDGLVDLPEVVRQTERAAMSVLRDIAARKISLGLSADGESEQAGGDSVKISAATGGEFSRKNLAPYLAD